MPGKCIELRYSTGLRRKGRRVEKFEYEFVEIVKNKLSDLDPGYAEVIEKLRRGMLLAKKGYPSHALSKFLTSRRKRYPEDYKVLEEELG